MTLKIRNRAVALTIALAAVMTPSTVASAQTAAPPKAAPARASAIPNLSGDWTLGRGGIGQSISLADQGGRLRGKEPDIPYQPWALAKTMQEVPPTGPDAQFEANTDPAIHFCEPLGLGRIYMYPAKTKFVQTPEAVYILHEIGPAFRVVWLNAKHPEDPDPQYWGHSIGHYEGGDTLVVDTIGVNDRSWLDQLGHPHTDQLHFIERYKLVADELQLEMTIDDPGAYTKPFPGHRNFKKSDTGFMRYMWVCSVRDNNEHYDNVGKTGNTGDSSFK